MQRRGADPLFHYLDDFLTVGRPQSAQCASNLQIMKQACSDTGTPIEPDRCKGPATVQGLLGLELDTEKLEMRLPQDKLHGLLEALSSCRGRKACRKRELLSLIGSFSHACKAVRPGRAFLKRLIDLSSVVCVIGLIATLLCKHQRPSASLVQRLISVILYSGHASKTVSFNTAILLVYTYI